MLKAALLLLIGGLALAGVGLFLVRADLTQQREQRASADWASATGRILSSRQVVVRTKNASHMRPEVTYEFEAGGRTIQGHRIAFFAQRDPDGAIVARYPAGADVAVFYDPADPSRSVLDRDSVGDRGTGLIFGSLFSVLGLAGFVSGIVLMLRARRRAPPLAAA